MEIYETPGVIPRNPEPEHEIVFEYNGYKPVIEPLFNNLKDQDEESNPDTWNVFDDPEVDNNEPRATRSGRIFGIQEFNMNQIEYPWFDEIN